MRSLAPRSPLRERAQSLVEFALVVPLFLVLLFALIDFGRLEFSYVALANATREMARSAAIPPNCAGTPCYTTLPSAADIQGSSVAVGQSFKNYESFILSDLHSATNSNKVTIVVTDRTGAFTSFECLLPLDLDPSHVATFCQVPSRFVLGTAAPDVGEDIMRGGSVEVRSTMEFSFNPIFRNRLTGMVAATFVQQAATLTTTARTYIE